ncbi:MAG: glycoside hydrolase family 31 protein [Acidobacteria bacterium]|nr:glycoside hydrolase family 31 protein [Acidobacteriota bacterium]
MRAMIQTLRLRRALLSATAALVCLLSFHAEARAVWRAAGDVKAVARQADGVVLTLTSGARVAVTFVTPEVVRVRLAPKGVFERDFSYAVESKERTPMRVAISDFRAPKSGFEARSDSLRLMMLGGASVVIRRYPFLVTVYDNAGRVLIEDDPARPASFDPETGAVQTSKRRTETETYYGFGEKALPISRHTQAMVMWNTDTYGYPRGTDPIYQAIGFFTALRLEQGVGRAYGIFLDNTTRTYFDMGKTEPERYTFGAASGELNYYVFTGGAERSPKNVLRDYTELTGRTPLPPLWALGNQQSRWSYSPESRVREIARRFRADAIPADVIYLDIDYMDGFRIFTWNKERFPDPSKMIADLRAEGFRVVVIVDPGIKADENYYAYKEGRAGDFFVKDGAGSELHASVWPGVCAFPDFTDPRAREWFGSLYRKNLDEGVAGFWNDMNEPGVFLSDETAKPDIFHHPGKTFPLDARHAGDGQTGTHARYHNVYGMQMARSTFEGLRRLRPDARPFVLTRAGYAGVQRYSAVWTGDNVADWDHLRLSIPMLTNLGVSGVPLVGADVGGFSGSPSAELYARWLQAAALTPFLRSHTEAGSKDQEPFAYGDEFTRINRQTIELRYKLLPYLYTLFHEHTETGAPVMRPLWFEYASDQRTYLLEDEYLVGRDLLVAPILTEGAVKRHVYFPKGDAWLDWWTGELHIGGTDADVDAPIDRLPLFARVGATIPTQPVIQHTGEMSRVPLTLTIIKGADGASSFFEDAGDGYDYRRGEFRTTTVTQDGNTLRLARAGAYNVSRPFAFVEFLGVSVAPREVRAGKSRIESVSFDGKTKRLIVPLPAAQLDEVTIVP